MAQKGRGRIQACFGKVEEELLIFLFAVRIALLRQSFIMKKSSRGLLIGSSALCCRPVRAGMKYFISAAGGNITSIEIEEQAFSRKEYINRGCHLMSMLSLHKA